MTLLRRPRYLRSEAARITAYHEAGHLVSAYHLGIPFEGDAVVGIHRDDPTGGWFRYLTEHLNETEIRLGGIWSRDKVERLAIMSLAGIEAQGKFCVASVLEGADLEDIDGADLSSTLELLWPLCEYDPVIRAEKLVRDN